MKIATQNQRRFPRDSMDGFTLIEMMLAVAILVVITVTVYQFTDVTLRATEASIQAGEEGMQCGGFRRLLATQLAALPAGQNGSLIGMNIKNKGAARRDALQLVCPAGNAVLTPDARGYYQITLDLREIPRGSGHFALGMERQPWSDDDDDDDDDDTAASKLKATDLRPGRSQLPSDWVQLMDNVKGLEIAYFDARLNGWVDKWTDQTALPNLVRVRLSILGASAPYEIVERVPGGGIAKIIANNSVINNAQRVLNPNGGGLNVNVNGNGVGVGGNGNGTGTNVNFGPTNVPRNGVRR